MAAASSGKQRQAAASSGKQRQAAASSGKQRQAAVYSSRLPPWGGSREGIALGLARQGVTQALLLARLLGSGLGTATVQPALPILLVGWALGTAAHAQVSITSISIASTPEADQSYEPGEKIKIQVQMSFGSFGTSGIPPRPTLSLTIGSNTRTATAASNFLEGATPNRGGRLNFEYEVQASDKDTNGISIPANPITKGAGNLTNVNVDYAGLTDQSGHKVNAVAGVKLSTTALTVTEGSSETYSVKLRGAPSANVTVAIAKDSGGDADLSVSPASLTFTPSNWSTGQTVTVTARADTDSSYGNASFTHTASSTDTSFNNLTASLAVTSRAQTPTISRLRFFPSTSKPGGVYRVGDLMQAIVDFSQDIEIDMEDQLTLTLSIGSETRNMTVASTVGSRRINFEYVIQAGDRDGNGISIPPDPIQVPSGSRIYSADDNNVDADLTYAGLTDQTTIQVDSDVRVSRAALALWPGHTGTYTVKLAQAPSANVTVAIARNSSGDADLSVSPTSLTFTPVNWSTEQTVTVTARADTDSSYGNATFTHTASSTDTTYNNITTSVEVTTIAPPAIRSISITSDPGTDQTYVVGDTITVDVLFTKGIFVRSTVGERVNLRLSIGGSVKTLTYSASSANLSTSRRISFSYTVKLGDSDTDGISIPASPLRVAAGNSITATTAEAQLVEPAVNADLSYAGLADQAGHKVDGLVRSVDVSSGTLTVTEGATATYAVKLGKAPSANVTVAIARNSSGDADLSVNPASLTFTPSNWDTEQTVTVSAAEDTDNTNGSASFTHTASSTDTGYDGLTASVVVTEDDNEGPGVLVSKEALTVRETTPGTYTVQLRAEPSANVTVAITKNSGGDADLSVSPTSLTFTSGNWSTGQTVTVTARGDTDSSYGSASFTHTASSTDTGYAGLTASVVVTAYEVVTQTGTVTEDDTTANTASGTVPGGFPVGTTDTTLSAGFTYGTFTIKADRTWTYTLDNTRAATQALQAGQTATETYRLDNTAQTAEFVITITINGADDGLTLRIAPVAGNGVTIPSSDAQRGEIDEDAASGTVTLAVTLFAPSTGPVTVAYATADFSSTDTAVSSSSIDPATAGADYTAASGTLTFAAGETRKTITVSISDDVNRERDELFKVGLSNATGGAVIATTGSEATILIDDDDPRPKPTITASVAGLTSTGAPGATDNTPEGFLSVAEGDSGNTDIIFTATREGTGYLPVTFEVNSIDGSATGNEDYRRVSLDLFTIAPGQTTGTFTLSVVGDENYEPNETLFLEFTWTDLGTITNSADSRFLVEVTITNDDAVMATSASNLQARPAGSGKLAVSWDPAFGAPNGYSVRWRKASESDTALSAVNTVTATSYTITGLDNDTSYHVRLDTRNLANDGIASGTSLTTAATPTAGAAPTVTAIANQSARVGQPFEVDVDATPGTAGDSLQYQAASSAPAVATVTPTALTAHDANSQVTVTPVAAGTATITVTVSDGTEVGTETFDVTVLEVTLGYSAAPPTLTVDTPITALTATAAGFGSATVSYAVTTGTLPAGLTINAGSGAISGTPTAASTTTTTVTVTATAGTGMDTQTATADITFPAVGKATLAKPTNLALKPNSNTRTGFTVTWDAVPNAAGYTATATPSGGSAVTGTVSVPSSGPEAEFTGLTANTTYTVTVTATGDANYSVSEASDGFGVTTAANQDPTVGTAIPDQTATVDTAFEYSFPAGTFSDADSDSLTYTAQQTDGTTDSALPTWLTFTASERKLAGTPQSGDIGTLMVKVTASDGMGGSVSDTFNIVVAVPSLTYPALPTILRAGVQFATLTPASPANFAAGSTFTYAVTAGDLPSGLELNANTGAISGTPDTPKNTRTSVTVTVTGTTGTGGSMQTETATATLDFPRIFRFRLPAPTVTLAVGSGQLTANWEAVANAGTYALQWKESSVTSWTAPTGVTTVDPATPGTVITGLTNGTIYDVRVRSKAASSSTTHIDGDWSSPVQGAPANSAPTVATIPDQTATVGVAFSFPLPVGTFSDADSGDSLTYTAMQTDGMTDSALPTWLTFTAGTGVFSGTPTSTDTGTLSVKVTASDGTASVSDTFNIVVNVPPALTFSKDSLTVDEGGSNTYTVALVVQPTENVTVAVTVSGSSDVTVSSSSASLTFTSTTWNTAQTVTVTAAPDDDAGDDTATVNHAASGGGYNSVTGSVPVTVDDPDTPALEFAPTSVVVNEGVGSSDYTVALATQPSATVTVTVGGTASTDLTVDTDPGTTGNQNTLTFTTTNWSTAQTVMVSAAEDADTVDDRVTLSHTVTGGDYGSVTGNLEVRVDDDDSPGLVFKPTALTVDEGGSATYTLALATQPAGNVTVTVGGTTNSDVTVDTDTDTAGTQDTLTFGNSTWNTPQTVTVSAANDDDTIDDSITLTHTTTGYNSVRDNLTVTVDDDDQSLTYSAAPTTLTVGTPITALTATATGFDSTPSYALTTGSLPAGLTINESTGAITGAPTAASTSTTTVTVTATAGTGVDTQTATANITFPAVGKGTLAKPTSLALKANSNTRTGFTVTWDAVANAAGYTATAVQGGNSFTGAVSVPSSGPEAEFTGLTASTTYTVTVTATGDANYEMSEASAEFDVITVANSAPTVGIVIPDQTATVDTVFEYSFPAGTFSDGDSDSLTYTVTRSDDSMLPTWLTFTASERKLAGTPQSGDTGTLSVKVTASDGMGGSVSDTFNIVVSAAAVPSLTYPALPTTLRAGVQFETLTPASPANFAAGSTFTYAVTAGNLPSGLEINANTGAISGTPDTPKATRTSVTVTVTGATGTGESRQTETATAMLDFPPILRFKLPAPTVTLALGSGQLTANWEAVADAASYALQWKASTTTGWSSGVTTVDPATPGTVLTGLTNGTSYDVRVRSKATPSSTTHIDGDWPSAVQGVPTADVSFSVTGPAAVAEDAGTATYTVTLSAQPAASVTVDYATADGTATADADYTAASGTLTFTPANWETAQTVAVTISNDTVDDDNETFTFTLSNPGTGAVLSSTASSQSTTITDNNVPALTVSFGAATYSVREGATVSVAVSLSAMPERSLTIPLTATNGTGATSSDYSVPRSVTFASTETSKTLTFSATDDAVDEANETVTLGFGTLPPQLTAGTTSQAAVTITDDDSRGLMLSATSLAVNENASGTYTVELSSQPTTNVTVTVGGATGDISVDTSTESGDQTTLTFTPTNWSMPQPVTVVAADDDDAVTDTAVTLTHTASSGDYASLIGPSLSVTITENDTRGVTLSTTTNTTLTTLTVNEGDTESYTVVLNSEPTGDVTVTIGGTDNTDITVDTDPATTGDQTTLTFTPTNWSTPRMVMVKAADDDDAVNDAVVTLTHTASGGDYTSLTGPSLSVNIIENDAATFSATGPATIAEGASTATYTVSLSARPSANVTINYATADGTATAGSDYTAASGTLTFTPANWETNQTVDVTITEDTVDENDETFNFTLSNPGSGAVLSASPSLSTTITDNDVPALTVSFGATIPAQTWTVDVSVDLTLPEATGGNGTISYELTPDLPPGVMLDRSTRTLSGAPTAAATATTYTWRATDSDGNTAALTFTVTVSPAPNLEATLRYPAAPTTLTVGTTITPLPATTTGLTAPITYAVSPDLPAGLTLSTTTGEISGTPTTMNPDGVTVTVTATTDDSETATANITFPPVAAAPPLTEERRDEVNTEILPSIINQVAENQVAIITGRSEFISSGLNRGNLSMEEAVTDVADYLFSHHQEIQANGFDWRQALSGKNFSFALADTSTPQSGMDDGKPSSSGSGPLSFWGAIDYSSLQDNIETISLDGDTLSFNFGVDKEFTSDLVLGILLSIANSEFDLTGGFTGTYEVDLSTLNPYISWEASEDLSLWASVGYGRGQVDLTETSGNAPISQGGNFTRFSAGGRFQLWQSEAGTGLALKLDGTAAHFLEADVQRSRLATELSHDFSIESGVLNTALELGLLMSSADESAAELVGGLHWRGDAGLSGSIGSRVLLGGGDRQEWGIGGALRYTAGGDGEGLMMALEPSFGISNPQLLPDLWQVTTSNPATTTAAPTARLNAKLAYGFPTTGGLLTPYTDFSFSDTTSTYGAGLRYGLSTGLDLDLKGTHKTTTMDDVENSILLELRSDL